MEQVEPAAEIISAKLEYNLPVTSRHLTGTDLLHYVHVSALVGAAKMQRNGIDADTAAEHGSRVAGRIASMCGFSVKHDTATEAEALQAVRELPGDQAHWVAVRALGWLILNRYPQDHATYRTVDQLVDDMRDRALAELSWGDDR